MYSNGLGKFPLNEAFEAFRGLPDREDDVHDVWTFLTVFCDFHGVGDSIFMRKKIHLNPFDILPRDCMTVPFTNLL